MESEWWRTAHVLALIYNSNRPKGATPVEPHKFNPYAEKPEPRQATPEELEKLLGPDWNK